MNKFLFLAPGMLHDFAILDGHAVFRELVSHLDETPKAIQKFIDYSTPGDFMPFKNTIVMRLGKDWTDQ